MDPSDLRDALRSLDTIRRDVERKRRRTVIAMAVACSLVVHLVLMVWLAWRTMPGGGGGPEPTVMPAVQVSDDDVELFETDPMQDLLLETPALEEDVAPGSTGIEADPTAAAVQLEALAGGPEVSLGGSGTGFSGLGGGGAGASFFGLNARGTRFVFIVDRSGSMDAEGRWRRAAAELVRSVGALPDFAYFQVLLYSTRYEVAPIGSGESAWVPATGDRASRLAFWLDGVRASGGTNPLGAFEHAFDLDPRPDAIFFLTDGQIPENTPDEVAALNRRGARVVVHCVAFGDPSSQALLERIAEESGGTYRFVASVP